MKIMLFLNQICNKVHIGIISPYNPTTLTAVVP